MSYSPNKYINALLDQDPKGIERIYLDFGDRVAAYVSKNGGNAHDAKDIMQDALIIIWNRAGDPDFKLTTDFYGFLYGICRNLWLRQKKKKDNNTVTLSAVEGFTSEQSFMIALEQQERQQIFVEHLRRLDEQCRKILELFFQGCSMKTIAGMLNIENEHAARNRKYRCQKKLEERILKDDRFKEL